MAAKTPAQILTEAADLIERGWCQGWYVDYREGLTCYCPIGAIGEAGRGNYVAQGVALDTLGRCIGCDFLSDWNDAPERTQAEVVAKLREAARLAEASHA